MFKKTSLILVLLAALTALPAAAGNYVETAAINPELLTPPPAVNTPAWQADLKTVLRAQKNATDKQKAEALAEAKLQVSQVTVTVNPAWTAATKPATFELLEKVETDCEAIVSAAKAFWNTRRPFVEDARVKNITGKIASGAYPSGHTACSRVQAEVLGQLAPAKRAELRQRAADIAWHRVVAGVHYPHDLKGGEQLALLIVGALQNSPNFQADLANAKAEIAE